MRPDSLKRPTRRTFYFIGVTTGKSSIMKVFPKWAEHLGLGDVAIDGIDCGVHSDPETYRQVVAFIKDSPLAVGALVTTHKLDLLKATRSMFDYLDPYAELLGEISSISKRDGLLRGHAKDPITAGLSLEAIVPEGYWKGAGAELCLLGAGGSSLALTCYLMKRKAAERPSRIVVTNRSPGRLDEMKAIHESINPGIQVEYVYAPKPAENDAVVGRLAPRSIVVNATGLGKDGPGSPLTDAGRFPERGIAWDFNYRGDLVFLRQAEAQKAERSLTVVDGWTYFVHGWTRVVAEVFDVQIPTSGPAFDRIAEIAASVR